MSNYQLFHNDLPAQALKSFKGEISIDTETLGLNIKRDRLCLIQLRNESNKKIYFIKFDSEISVKKSKNLKLILENKSIKKIFHYARADLAYIKYYLKTDVENVECTKIQSKLARTFSDSHSLKTLIKAFANIDISKQFQTSDFGGDLTSDQMKYCSNDVIYLHKIHDELNKILERENRIELYQDCLKFLKTRVDLDLALFKEDIWSH